MTQSKLETCNFRAFGRRRTSAKIGEIGDGTWDVICYRYPSRGSHELLKVRPAAVSRRTRTLAPLNLDCACSRLSPQDYLRVKLLVWTPRIVNCLCEGREELRKQAQSTIKSCDRNLQPMLEASFSPAARAKMKTQREEARRRLAQVERVMDAAMYLKRDVVLVCPVAPPIRMRALDH